MAITFIGAIALAANNPVSGDWIPAVGWEPGDVCVCWWYTYNNNKTITEPATVTQKYDVASASCGRLFIGYRILQAGDTTFRWASISAANATTVWGASVFRGVDGSGDPFEADSGAPALFGNQINPNPPAVDPISENACAYPLFGKKNDYTSIIPPANYASAGEGSSDDGSDASAGAAYRVLSSGNPEDPGAWTLGGGDATDDGFVWTGALKPAAEGKKTGTIFPVGNPILG